MWLVPSKGRSNNIHRVDLGVTQFLPAPQYSLPQIITFFNLLLTSITCLILPWPRLIYGVYL